MKAMAFVIVTLAATAAFAAADAAAGNAAVLEIIVSQRPVLESLYHDHFGESGAGTGTLLYAVTVTADGRVDTVAVVEDSIGDEEFGDAVQEVVRGWTMPKVIWGNVWRFELDFNAATSTYGANP